MQKPAHTSSPVAFPLHLPCAGCGAGIKPLATADSSGDRPRNRSSRSRTKCLRALCALAALLLSLVAQGCAATYTLEYGVVLKDHGTEGPLKFKDENFAFEFRPTPAGVAFSVDNLSDKDASLDWDRSFFVQPDGNSYKAINTDTLEEQNVIAMKSRYTTIVPRGARVCRFTTATVNAQQHLAVSMSGVANMYRSTRLDWDPTVYGPSGGPNWSYSSAATATSFYSLVVASTKASYTFPLYYTTSVTADDRKILAKLGEVTDQIRAHPKMSLGLTLTVGDVEKTYLFEFHIVSVFASQEVLTQGADKQESIERLAFTAREDQGWTWLDVRPSKPTAKPESHAEGERMKGAQP